MSSELFKPGGDIPFLDPKQRIEHPGMSGGNPDDQKIDGDDGLRPQKKRRRLIKLSALLVVVLPTLLAALYYGAYASDQYAVEVRFAVRGIDSGGGGDILGMVTGIPSAGSTGSDSYILMDYIKSREILEKLRKKTNLNEIYGRGKADFLSAFSPEDSIEKFVKYWRKMITLSYDSASQIIVVEVRAFSPEDAKQIAALVLGLSEELVNELSARARNDAIGHAKVEVARMEKRLRANRQNVRAFREKEQVIDPSKTADSRLSLLARLEGEIGIEKAKLSSLSQFMNEKSPRIKVLSSKISALEFQLKAQRARLAGSTTGQAKSQGPLTGLLEDYQILLMEQEFSEKAYISALSSLEIARLEASRRQRYLATFVKPSLPEDALYPKRILNILMTLIIATIIWAIGTLIVYAVRDHAT